MGVRDLGTGTRHGRGLGLESRAAALVAVAVLVPCALLGQNNDTSGIRLFETGKLREARAVLEPAFKANSRDAAAAFYLGRIALEERHSDRAADYFEAATTLDPNNTMYFLWLGRALGGEAHQASVLRQPGLARRTRAAWERAIELDPDNLDARADLIQYYVQVPGILGGSTARAIEQAEAIRKRNALRGYLELGAIYEREQALDKAEQAYLGAAKEKSDRHIGEYRLGVFYQNVGAYDKAFDLFESMVAANPSEFGALFQIGKTGAMSGQRLDRAAEALEAYLRTTPGRNDPSLAAAHWRLGMIHEKRRNRQRAKAEYEIAVRLDPTFKPASESLRKLT